MPRRRERVTAELVLTAPPATALAVPSRDDRVGELLQAFMARRSELTVRNYEIDLRHFAAWCGHATIGDALRELWALDALGATRLVNSYVADLGSGALGRRYSTSSINHRLAALRAITGTAHLFGLCTFDLSTVQHIPSKKARSTEGCGEEAYAKLLRVAEKRVTKARTEVERLTATRDAALVLLMHDAGLRRFEPLTILHPGGVDLKNGRVHILGKKRHDYEWFDVNGRVVAALARYIEDRGPARGPLFFGVRKRSKPLNRGVVNAILKDLAEEAGVEVTPHGLRHTAATTLLDKTDGNVRAVAEFLRHKSLTHVQAYDDARKKLPKQMGAILEQGHRPPGRSKSSRRRTPAR